MAQPVFKISELVMWADSRKTAWNLNIFAPSGYADMKPLPVMIWVYGGAFLTGSAGVDYSGLTFNGDCLAMHGVLVVTLQYRVGIFGFATARWHRRGKWFWRHDWRLKMGSITHC